MIQQHNYPTDLSDDQWFTIKTFLPKEKVLGRPRKWPYRIVMNAILYWVRNDIPLRKLPVDDFPPWSSVHALAWQWAQEGRMEKIFHALGDPKLYQQFLKKIHTGSPLHIQRKASGSFKRSSMDAPFQRTD